MVAALMVAALVAAAPADAAPDSSAAEAWRIEDALDEAEDEAVFIPVEVPDDRDGASSRGRAAALHGDFVATSDGARRLRALLAVPRLRAETLLAREAGEPRPIDDAYASLRVEVGPSAVARFGWFEPRVGAGLVLGPRRTGAAAPAIASAASSAWFDAPLAAAPARLAAAHRGVALEVGRGAFRLGALAAWTPREARASGAALQPVLGARHRKPEEEARRGALAERTLGLVVEAAPARDPFARAWLLVLATRTDARRAPHDGTSAAAESAAAVADGGPAGEAGARWRSHDGATSVEAALAFDAGGRARTRTALLARHGVVRAGLLVETEARGFVPPRALPERRPRLHAALRLERAAGAGGAVIAVEAHALERGPLERARPWIAVQLEPAGGRARLDVRHDGDPRATRLAVRHGDAAFQAGGEVRFDRAGLSRRSAWVGASRELPARFILAVEARLAGGRNGAVWLDDDISGARLVRPGKAAGRTRFELARRRPGVTPRLTWTRTTAPEGQVDDFRLEIAW